MKNIKRSKLDLSQTKDDFVKFGLKLKESVGSGLKKVCTVENVKKKIPITIWLPKYRPRHLLGDILAGLTVALTVIPQSLALAQIAYLPPNYGLYTSFMSCFVYSIFGTSKDITLGPTASMAILAIQFGETPIHRNATYIILLTFMTGVVQLGIGILHLGFAINFISIPVISAFASAASITIAWSQIKLLFGIRKLPRSFFISIGEFFRRIGGTNYWDLIAGVACILALVGLKLVIDASDVLSERFTDKTTRGRAAQIGCRICWLLGTARNAIVVLISAGVVALLTSEDINVLTLTGHIEAGLPSFRFPNLTLQYENGTISTSEIFSHIGTGIVITPFISILQSIAIAKALARRNNYRIDPNQEIIALGLANFLGAFVGAFPVTASFSRSNVNSQTGACTPAGGIVTGATVILALAVLTPCFYYIPTVALAAVILVAVLQSLDLGVISALWRYKKIDLIPYFTTFILSFVLGIEYGIIVGIALSLVMILYPMARPQMRVKHKKLDSAEDTTEDTSSEPSNYDSQEHLAPARGKDIVIIQPSLGMEFPCVETVHERVMEEASEDTECKGLVLDCTHISSIDYTALHNMIIWHSEMDKCGIKLVFACLQDNAKEILNDAEIDNFLWTETVEEACELILKLTLD